MFRLHPEGRAGKKCIKFNLILPSLQLFLEAWCYTSLTCVMFRNKPPRANTPPCVYGSIGDWG